MYIYKHMYTYIYINLFIQPLYSQALLVCRVIHSVRSASPDKGYSKLRTHTALGPYGRSMSRIKGHSYGRCVSLIASNACKWPGMIHVPGTVRPS